MYAHIPYSTKYIGIDCFHDLNMEEIFDARLTPLYVICRHLYMHEWI
jgi:hypothetical protein